MANKINRLFETLAATAPIFGASVPNVGSSVGVRIDFTPAATGAQQTAANNALTAFDWSDAADLAWKDTQNPDFATMRDNAVSAFNSNTTYLAIASPSNAQVAAQVRTLTQQNNQIIKALAKLATGAVG